MTKHERNELIVCSLMAIAFFVGFFWPFALFWRGIVWLREGVWISGPGFFF